MMEFTDEERELIVKALDGLRHRYGDHIASEMRNVLSGNPLDPRPGEEFRFLHYLRDRRNTVTALRDRVKG